MRFASLTVLALSAAAALVTIAPAFAWQRHHHHASRSAPPDYGQPYPRFYGGGWQAEAIARATREMQNAPGVTNELAPDAKETATGGPSGGVPGFSGH